MTKVCTNIMLGAAAVVCLSACQVEKSANPLSPAIAGPVAGVVISTPNLLEPGQDWELKTRDQPIKLLFQNADTNGARPLKYSFDIAADANFKNIVFARTGVEPNAAGVTQFQMPDKLAAGTYWWRTRAEDGANTGPYSATKSFNVLADVILAPPIPSTPSNGTTVSDLTPDFRVKAGNRSGVTADLEYIVQIANNSSFTSIAAIFTQRETWPETRIDQGYSFLYDKTYYWRVRAWHTADGSDLSNWSSVQTFKTPHPPAGPPPPPPPPPGGGGGGRRRRREPWRVQQQQWFRYRRVYRVAVSLVSRSRRQSGPPEGEHAVPARSNDRARQVQGPQPWAEPQAWRTGNQR